MSDNEINQNEKKDNSRRTFLRNSGLTVGGLVLGGAVGSLLNINSTEEPKPAKIAPVATAMNPNEALMFFTPDQYKIAEAAAERIFPEDDLGPGAKGLNAAIYIDHQLAGQWGVNAKDYMQAPFYNPEPTQGIQSRILRKDMFLIGLAGLDDYSKKKYKKNFTELDEKAQDDILIDFEKGTAYKLSGISTSQFFNQLRALTLEGIYSDPMYGGNKDMQGWKMRQYPGSQMAYITEVQSEKFIVKEPQSLRSHMGH